MTTLYIKFFNWLNILDIVVSLKMLTTQKGSVPTFVCNGTG